MSHGKYAVCPNCGKTAYDDDIEVEFGYRYNGTKPQSWCKECRSRQSATPSYCPYNLCEWQSEFPSCIGTVKCPLEDL